MSASIGVVGAGGRGVGARSRRRMAALSCVGVLCVAPVGSARAAQLRGALDVLGGGGIAGTGVTVGTTGPGGGLAGTGLTLGTTSGGGVAGTGVTVGTTSPGNGIAGTGLTIGTAGGTTGGTTGGVAGTGVAVGTTNPGGGVAGTGLTLGTTAGGGVAGTGVTVGTTRPGDGLLGTGLTLGTAGGASSGGDPAGPVTGCRSCAPGQPNDPTAPARRTVDAATRALLRSTLNELRRAGAGSTSAATSGNTVVIGAGAPASGPGQVVVGAPSTTVTMPGIASAASAAAQSGPTRFVSTDAAGTLAASPYGPSSIADLQGRVGGLEAQTAALARYDAETRRESRQGVAAALALGSASMPSAPGRTSWVANTATYRGEWAGGIAVAHRLPFTDLPVAVTGGIAYGGDNSVGARAGLAGEF